MIPSSDKRLVIILSSAFFITAIVGVLSHEAGHFVVAKYFGYAPHLGYDFTNFHDEEALEDTSEYGKAILNYRRVWMLAGGPIETMAVGTIGLVLLFLVRKQATRNNLLTPLEWVLVILSSFWMREIINFLSWIGKILYLHKFSFQMDEIKISQLLDIPIWIIPSLCAVSGAIILLIVTTKFIPKIQQPTFIASLSIGGILGSLLWLGWLGQALLP